MLSTEYKFVNCDPKELAFQIPEKGIHFRCCMHVDGRHHQAAYFCILSNSQAISSSKKSLPLALNWEDNGLTHEALSLEVILRQLEITLYSSITSYSLERLVWNVVTFNVDKDIPQENVGVRVRKDHCSTITH